MGVGVFSITVEVCNEECLGRPWQVLFFSPAAVGWLIAPVGAAAESGGSWVHSDTQMKKTKVTFSRTSPEKEGGGEERCHGGARWRWCLCRVRSSGKYAAEGKIWGAERRNRSGVWATSRTRSHRGRDALRTRQQGRRGFGEGQEGRKVTQVCASWPLFPWRKREAGGWHLPSREGDVPGRIPTVSSAALSSQATAFMSPGRHSPHFLFLHPSSQNDSC